MNKKIKLVLALVFIIAIFIGVLFVANSLADNSALIETIASFGYFGVIFIAIVAGLNTFIPLPAATFTPLFTASGLLIPLIILALALGTLIADFIGFMLGHVSRNLVLSKYPKIFNFITNLQQNHKKLITPVVLLYASFVPFPNEALLLPLALAGIKFRSIIIPLVIGNIIHQALIIYGISSINNLLF
jgi:membrane protein YqaA with SNARE-associated domain